MNNLNEIEDVLVNENYRFPKLLELHSNFDFKI